MHLVAMAPAPDPAICPMDVVEESTSDQNNVVVSKSKDVSMGRIKENGDLHIPCSKPAVSPEDAPDKHVEKGGDTTECSSSFGDTYSVFDDEADSGEPEVNSKVFAPADGDWSRQLPRRKKVTAEWRNAVRPIMWRCQWLKLRMKELSSQVSKYDKQLAVIKKQKEQHTARKANGSMQKLLPIGKGYSNGIMKRRQRKRCEDVVDTTFYMRKHQILSYYNEKQNKGAETDGLLPDVCTSPVGGNIAGLHAEEVTLNDILSTIHGVQSRVHFLRDRLNKARSKEDKLAFSEENTNVRVPRKRQTHVPVGRPPVPLDLIISPGPAMTLLERNISFADEQEKEHNNLRPASPQSDSGRVPFRRIVCDFDLNEAPVQDHIGAPAAEIVASAQAEQKSLPSWTEALATDLSSRSAGPCATVIPASAQVFELPIGEGGEQEFLDAWCQFLVNIASSSFQQRADGHVEQQPEQNVTPGCPEKP